MFLLNRNQLKTLSLAELFKDLDKEAIKLVADSVKYFLYLLRGQYKIVIAAGRDILIPLLTFKTPCMTKYTSVNQTINV